MAPVAQPVHASAMSDFDRMGGESRLRIIIEEFVDRVFDDVMIGFHFRNAKRKRVKRFEYEHAAEFLGAGVVYGGRPLREAHGEHRIMGGQFDRRTQILRDVLNQHDVDPEIRDRWIAHVESLRGEITGQGPGICIA